MVGGAMQPGSPSYVQRPADNDLFERALRGDLCYVLTSRQMGKTSLMARTAQRLRDKNVKVAPIDMSGIGTETATPENWFFGLTEAIIDALRIDIQFDGWWDANALLPPTQRFVRALRDLILAKIDEHVLIFFDEIDSTIKLNFTDDFFAALRACHNQRATSPEFERLGFVLLGVASPSDLISDRNRTPFNVGHSIELTDFDPGAARRLGAGLSSHTENVDAILERVLWWTSGHPYLTQFLCKLARSLPPNDLSVNSIDKLVNEHFFAPGADRSEHNLKFVRDRLTEGKASPRRILRRYDRIRKGKKVKDNSLSPVDLELKLSGVVKVTSEGYFEVRNRIYGHVFSVSWVNKEIPRDRTRQAALSLAILSLLVSFLTYFVYLPRPWEEQIENAKTPQDAKLAYERLENHPFHQRKADKLWAKLWDRHRLAVSLDQGRDHAILAGLKALSLSDTKARREELAQLIGQNYHKLQATFRHRAPVKAVAFSPDGRTILTGSSDGTARIWKADLTGTPIDPPLSHESPVLTVAFSPDGQTVLTGCDDGTVRLWSVDRLKSPSRRPMSLGSPILKAGFSPDGQRVITSSSDGTTRIWDIQSVRQLGPVLRHDSMVFAVAFSPDGQEVFTGSFDGTVRLWSNESELLQSTTMRHDSVINTMAFSPNGQTIITGGWDRTARLWRAESGIQFGSPMHHDNFVHENPIYATAFSMDSQKVLTASKNGTVRLWDATTGAPIGDPIRHQFAVSTVAFSPDGQKVLTGSEDGAVRIWSTPSGKPRHTKNLIIAAALSPDGQQVVTSSDDGTIRAWSTDSKKPSERTLRHDYKVITVAFSPDGQRIITGNDQGAAQLWEADSLKPVGRPMYHDSKVQTVAFSPDGQEVLTGSDDRTARIWDADSGLPIGPAIRLPYGVRTAIFSPDGQKILTGSFDKTARILSVETGQPIGSPMSHKSWVRAVAFHPDGTKTLTGSLDGKTRIWNSESQKLEQGIGSPISYPHGVQMVAFSHDGQHILTQTFGGLYLHRIEGQELRHVATRFYLTPLIHAFRFNGQCPSCLDLVISDSSARVESINLLEPDVEPLQGDTETLLEEWQRRLALTFDENMNIVPMYPISTPNERDR